MQSRIGVAVVGAGYWGPNLARNLRSSPDWELRAVCDLDLAKAQRIAGDDGRVRAVQRLDDVLDDPAVRAVVVATPARTHADVALQALEAGRHVLVEKPLASSLADGRKLVDRAAALGLTLMCDHTYCYTPAVQRMRDIVAGGVLGDIQFVDSVRLNLGIVQPDVDVLWDLAPHDISILDLVLPQGISWSSVSAHGADPIGAGHACVGYLTLPLDNGAIAHSHVNWLSPTKIRTMVVGGSRRTMVFDDLNPQQRLSVYDRGVELYADRIGPDQTREARVSYRLGDMTAPALPEREALGGVIGEFARSIREGTPPLTGGEAGVRVLEILEAAGRSMAAGGAPIGLEEKR